MWRTVAGGLVLAVMAMPGAAVNAAGDLGRAGNDQKARKEKPTRAPKAPGQLAGDQSKPAGAAAANDVMQPPRMDDGAGSAAIAADDEAGDTVLRASQPARNQPEMLNRGEMLSLVRKYAAEIAESLVDGEKHREVAVREKDAIKLACIQDRLSNMKLVKRMADERLVATERPTIRQDELSLRHEFRGVEMAHKRVSELSRELKECVGESLQVTGPSGTVPTTVDPSASNAEIPRMERPAPASVFN